MTMFLAPYTAIADIDGSPLDAGYLYLGEYGKDPASFPVEVFWDADLTVPAAQPIRTRNGYPVRNGSPTKVYLKTAQHSIAIKNRKGAFVLVDFYNKGWDASFVVDASGKTQQEINDLNSYELKSIFWFMTTQEIASFKLAEPRTFDFTTIINRTLASFNAVTSGGTKQVLYLPAIIGGYRITDTIWTPKYTGVVGDGGSLWQFNPDVAKKSSSIYADFADPYKFVISSDTRVLSTNTRIPYSQLIEGNTMDGMGYSWSDGVVLKGFNILTKSRVFGGIKLIGAVSSFIDSDVIVRGCDYGYVTSACWNSKHLGGSLSYKCGYLGYDALNGSVVDGYHNNAGAPMLTTTNLLNFFESGYYIPHALMNQNTTRFGVVLRKCFGVTGNKLIAEHSAFPIVLYDRCQASYNAIYAENVSECAMTLGNLCQLSVGSAVGGLKNGAAMQLGTHAKLSIQNYYMVADVKHIYGTGDWGSTAYAEVPSRYFPEYHPNIKWNDKNDNVIYVSPAGSSTNNGASYYHPTNLTQAIRRIARVSEKYDKGQLVDSNISHNIYCTDNGSYTLNESYLTIKGSILIQKKKILSQANVILDLQNFVYLSNCNLEVNGLTVNIADKSYDYVAWARNAPFIVSGGINNILLNSCVTNFAGTAQGIVSFTDTADSITNFNIRGGSINGGGDLICRAENQRNGNIVNLSIGASCAVDAIIKAKANSGLNISKNQVGVSSLGWVARFASKTFDPPSIPANATINTTVDMTGTKVGDMITVSFDQYHENIEITAVVSAPDVVTVKFRNNGATAVDLQSGTINIKLI